jgi:hypothetical protein
MVIIDENLFKGLIDARIGLGIGPKYFSKYLNVRLMRAAIS